MIQITPIPALQDNYIWCLHHTKKRLAWIVDPGVSDVVIDFLEEKSLTLKGILVTHHHWDHTNGIDALTKAYPTIQVIGGTQATHASITHYLKNKESILLDGIDVELTLQEIAGHTLDHVCYYNNDYVFCGDTLFSAGCGRLFEGSAQQMWRSLDFLQSLPEQALFFCAHEYTQANIEFALHVDPDNKDLQNYQRYVEQQRKLKQTTLPSSVALEKKINPFLRCNDNAIKTSVGQHYNETLLSEEHTFELLRKWKDSF